MSLTTGTHHARALDAAFGVARTGTKQVAVTFEITDGECAGERVTWYGFFTEKTAERTIAALRTCGCTFPNSDVTNLEGLAKNLVALKCVEELDGDGNPIVRAAFVNPIPTSGAAVGQLMDDAQKRKLATDMRGLLAATPPPQRAPATRTNVVRPSFGAPRAAQANADDDVAY